MRYSAKNSKELLKGERNEQNGYKWKIAPSCGLHIWQIDVDRLLTSCTNLKLEIEEEKQEQEEEEAKKCAPLIIV